MMVLMSLSLSLKYLLSLHWVLTVAAGIGFIFGLYQHAFNLVGDMDVRTTEEEVETAICMENLGVAAGDWRDQEGNKMFFPFLPEEHLIPGNIPGTVQYSTIQYNWYWQRETSSISDRQEDMKVVENAEKIVSWSFIVHKLPDDNIMNYFIIFHF